QPLSRLRYGGGQRLLAHELGSARGDVRGVQRGGLRDEPGSQPGSSRGALALAADGDHRQQLGSAGGLAVVPVVRQNSGRRGAVLVVEVLGKNLPGYDGTVPVVHGQHGQNSLLQRVGEMVARSSHSYSIPDLVGGADLWVVARA